MKTLLTLIATLLLATGCAHNAHRTAEAQAYYEAQRSLADERPPLFELRAQPGEAIVLQGVAELVVHDPREQAIRALPAQRSQALELFGSLLRIGGQVYGMKVVADSVVDLADSVGRNAGDHSTTRISDSYNPRGHTVEGDATGSALGDGNAIDNTVGDRAGRDLIGRDRIDNQGRIGSDGDDAGRDQIRNRGRIDSPGDDRDRSDGPIDDRGGDCRDGADCSMPPPANGGG